jgi:outer membrane protein TolC
MKPILLPLAIGLFAGACASYAPDPLSEQPAVLAPTITSVLVQRASAVDRAWLPPVAVDLGAPLPLEAIAALAVVNNPDLAALRARAGVAEAQAFAAGLLPDPSFSIGADRVLRGPDTLLNLTAALGLNLAALQQRALTRRQADAQARQVRLDLAWAEWQTAGQSRLQALRVIGLGRSLPLLRDAAAVAKRQWQRNNLAAARGDIPASAAETARIAIYDAEAHLRTGEHELLAARGELARLLGLSPGTVPELAATGLPPPAPGAAQVFAQAMRRRDDLAALRAGYQAQEAGVRMAILGQFPAINLTLNGNRDSAGNLLAGPAVDVSLPLWNRNRGAIAVEHASRAALKAEYEARLFQTRADIDTASNGIALARRQHAEALAGLATLQQQAAANAAAVARGDLPPAAADAAGQALRDRQLTIAQLEQAIGEQTIALELLAGGPFEESP